MKCGCECNGRCPPRIGKVIYAERGIECHCVALFPVVSFAANHPSAPKLHILERHMRKTVPLRWSWLYVCWLGKGQPPKPSQQFTHSLQGSKGSASLAPNQSPRQSLLQKRLMARQDGTSRENAVILVHLSGDALAIGAMWFFAFKKTQGE